jgi:hypothetical protein
MHDYALYERCHSGLLGGVCFGLVLVCLGVKVDFPNQLCVAD